MAISKIKDILLSLDLHSEHAFSFTINSTTENLRISVTDVGEIKFPVNKTTINKLIKQAKPALFGYKENTLYDPSIRHTWEIAKSRVKIDKRIWKKQFDLMLNKMASELFPEGTQLQAQLHNMLVYEPGQFFKKHQDTEKTDAMQASLIVILPTKEELRGGNLIIQHSGTKKVYGKKKTGDLLQYVGFYADCIHQVSKVSEGHRLALTFNVSVISPGKTLHQPPPELINAIDDFFENPLTVHYSSIEERGVFCALAHQYTPKNLSWDKLKGNDIGSALALKATVEALGLNIYLGSFEYRASYDAESDDDNHYDRYRRDRYNHHEEEKEESDYTIGELLSDDWSWVSGLDANGKAIEQPNYNLYHADHIDLGNLNDLKVEEEEYEGFMGNYGNTVDRLYHRAGILIRDPKAERLSVIINAPLKELKRIAKLPEKQAHEQFKKLFPYTEGFPLETKIVDCIVNIGIKFKSPDLLHKLISDKHRHILFELPIKTLAKLDNLSKQAVDEMLKQELKMSYRENSLATTLLKSCVIDPALCKGFAYITPCLLNEATKKITYDYCFDRSHHTERVNLAVMIINFTLNADCFSKVTPLLQHIEKHPRAYPAEIFVSTFPPTAAILQIKALDNLYKNFLRQLNYLVETQPRQDVTSIAVDDFCACKKCQDLRSFLGSTSTHTKLQLFKKDQEHISSIIRHHALPVKHEFGSKASRYHVEYTKNVKAAFKTQVDLYKASQQALAILKTVPNRFVD